MIVYVYQLQSEMDGVTNWEVADSLENLFYLLAKDDAALESTIEIYAGKMEKFLTLEWEIGTIYTSNTKTGKRRIQVYFNEGVTEFSSILPPLLNSAAIDRYGFDGFIVGFNPCKIKYSRGVS
jgi:hypothetical protein